MEWILVISLVFLLSIWVYVKRKPTKKSDNKTENIQDVSDNLHVLIELSSDIERVDKESLSLLSSIFSNKEMYSQEDIYIFQDYEVEIQESLYDALEEIEEYKAALSDISVSRYLYDVTDFNLSRNELFNKLLEEISLQNIIQMTAVNRKTYENLEQLIIEQAKCMYITLVKYVRALETAHFFNKFEFTQRVKDCIVLFLVNISASDTERNEKEINFFNLVLLNNKSLEDFKDEYLVKVGEVDPVNQMGILSQSIQNHSDKAAHYINESFRYLLLCLIAVDGREDDSELDKMQEYFDFIRVHLNIETGSHDPFHNRKHQITIKPEPKSESGQELESLGELLAQLNKLIGLNTVKHEVNNICNLARVNEMRLQANLPTNSISLHQVFTGNPGTGKTTVARLLAKIFRELNILSKGHLVEVARVDLVGGYVGQTAIKTQEVINESLGGILFIDEAYSLTNSSSDVDFGNEAIETLLKAMEDNRDDLIIIVAGYPEEMSCFINSNPGVKSRFSKYINFPDYDEVELVMIIEKLATELSYDITPDAFNIIGKIIIQRYQNKGKYFGNARMVRNLFEHIIQKQSNRIITIDDPSHDELQTITEDDVACFLEEDFRVAEVLE